MGDAKGRAAVNLFGSLDRAAVRESLGLACYIAWSFIFWNGTTLTGDVSRVQTNIDSIHIAQGVVTAVSALLLVASAKRVAPLWRSRGLLLAFAVVSSAAVAMCAAFRAGQAPAGLLVAAFALSGLGSTLRLGWEERLSVQGVKHTAACVALAYAMGFVAFVGTAAIGGVPAFAIACALPFCAFALLARDAKPESDGGQAGLQAGRANPFAEKVLSVREQLRGIPWNLMALVALAFFGYGATRSSGVFIAGQFGAVGQGIVLGLPALASLLGIVIAYACHKEHSYRAFYIAFPVMAAASLIPPQLDPFSGGTAFFLVLLGGELVKYLVWFLLIGTIVLDGVSALVCLGVLRCVQWAGSVMGQCAAAFIPSHEGVSMAILVSLVFALLCAMAPAAFSATGAFRTPAPESGARSGFDDGARLSESGESRFIDAANPAAPLEGRVAALAQEFALTPRETEVLGVWATGHSIAYVEKKLFISKSTVKTHLNHIYAKTGTANREQLLELLEQSQGDGACGRTPVE